MKAPCELIVWYILPSIRAGLASTLIESGVSQKEVAAKLGITQAAVSQYLSKKRGSSTELGEEAMNAIRELGDSIIAGDFDLLTGICDICRIVRKSGVLCDIHREMETVPDNCNMCTI
ncbi:MAG: XRE family transcriptional regulator [Candidatus Syntrophoarchaeum caldarius]|uniref:XRE family transcriptional regulator n=1 Tax=Candidatus Syntropharchaeum caldarium TaxID=1838285 RepID=A0A1F2PBY5_9EURY|nr:MAG: XRE family transcriptional regulator [Candidatus Syntrophoarchaeum caldarius]